MYAEGHGKDIGAYRECRSGEERIRGAKCRPRSPFLLFSCTSILVYEIHTGARAQPERRKRWVPNAPANFNPRIRSLHRPAACPY
jgi:hypothetical protein